MDKLICTTCKREELPRYAKLKGWLIRPKTSNPDEMFIICDSCLNLGSATLDTADGAPFRKLERKVKREKVTYGDN